MFNEEQMGGLLALKKCELMINMSHGVISDHAFNAAIFAYIQDSCVCTSNIWWISRKFKVQMNKNKKNSIMQKKKEKIFWKEISIHKIYDDENDTKLQY